MAHGRAADAHRAPYQPDEPAGKAAQAAASADGPGARRPPRRGGRAAAASRFAHAAGDRRAMVQSLQTAATCTTIAEADMSRIEAARSAAGMSYLPYQARATIETLLEFPAAQRHARGRHAPTYDARAPRHRGLAGRGRPDRPDHPRRAGPSVEGLAKRIKDIAAPRPRQPAQARRGPRRHVHDHQPRRLRLDHGHAGDQPAAGRHPRHRGRRQAAGR